MRKAGIVLILFVSVLFPLISSGADDELKKISVEELKAALDAGADIVILDNRSDDAYDASEIKIKGAVRMPWYHVERRHKELPQDKTIVTYCT